MGRAGDDGGFRRSGCEGLAGKGSMNISGLLHRARARARVTLGSATKDFSLRGRRAAVVRWAAWRCVEALESRTLLSTVSGTVYSDVSLNGSYGGGDPALAHVR